MLQWVIKVHKSSVNIIHHILNVCSQGCFVNFHHFLDISFIWACWFFFFFLYKCPILRHQNTAVRYCLCFLELTVLIFAETCMQYPNSFMKLQVYNLLLWFSGWIMLSCTCGGDGEKDKKCKIKTSLGSWLILLGFLRNLIQLAVETTTFQKDTNSS